MLYKRFLDTLVVFLLVLFSLTAGAHEVCADSVCVADTVQVPNAGYVVTVCDSASLLPPDTAAVVAGFGGDAAFGVEPAAADPTHRFRPAEWIVPGAAAVFGALCVNTSWGQKLRREAHHTFSAKGLYKVTVDDYMQYSPAVALYALNLCGMKGQHGFRDRTILLGMSYAIMAAVVNTAKYTFREMRPDSSTRNSFPSGHTATAFVGAEILYQEYRTTHPWVGYTAYAVSAGVGYLRMHNDRHWANDVLAGAAVGILSTKLAYWLYPRLFREHTPRRRGGGGRSGGMAVAGVPYYSGGQAGVSMSLVF